MADAKFIEIGPLAAARNALSFTNFALNQSTDSLECIFQMPEAATLETASFRYALRTGTPPTYRISLQGVDGTGIPDGSVKASQTFTPPADATWNSTWRTITFAASYAAARGELLALVIDYSSGTVDGGNNSNISSISGNWWGLGTFPYAIQNDGGSRTRPGGSPAFAVSSSSKAYLRPALAAYAPSVTSTAEAGVVFTLPAGWGATYKVVGLKFIGTFAAGQTLTMRLYSGGGASDTTVIQDVTHDTDILQANTIGEVVLYFNETSLSALNFGDSYRASLQVGAGTNTLAGLTVNAAADWEAWPAGQLFGATSRTGGNWTDAPESRPFLAIILADITKPGGGSGGGLLIGPGRLVY